MELQIDKVLDLYDQKLSELNRKVILLTLENEELKKLLEQKDE